MTRRNDFTVYDKNDQTTWPPGEGLDILVCYRNRHDELVWTITWSNYGHNHDYAAMLDHGTDWSDLDVQYSPWVAWRLLNETSDAPNDAAAERLSEYYVHHPVDGYELVDIETYPPELAAALVAADAEAAN